MANQLSLCTCQVNCKFSETLRANYWNAYISAHLDFMCSTWIVSFYCPIPSLTHLSSNLGRPNITETRTHLQLWSIAHQVWTWCVWHVMYLTCFCCIHKAFPTSRSLTTGCTWWVNKCKLYTTFSSYRLKLLSVNECKKEFVFKLFLREKKRELLNSSHRIGPLHAFLHSLLLVVPCICVLVSLLHLSLHMIFSSVKFISVLCYIYLFPETFKPTHLNNNPA